MCTDCVLSWKAQENEKRESFRVAAKASEENGKRTYLALERIGDAAETVLAESDDMDALLKTIENHLKEKGDQSEGPAARSCPIFSCRIAVVIVAGIAIAEPDGKREVRMTINGGQP